MSPPEIAIRREVNSDPPEVACSAASGPGRILYRAMREDPGGGPLTGPTARTLGVRPGVDIPVAVGYVHPLTGGMSVAPDDPLHLHPLRRPTAYGGSGKDPLWALRLDDLGPELRFRQDSATHGLIEPSRAMSLNDFQQALAASKALWQRLP